MKNNPPIPPATKRIPKGINEFISNLLPVLTISIFLFVRLHVIISPWLVISNSPVSVVNSYPSGALVSEILYLPFARVNLLPSLLEVNSIT